MNRLLDFEIDVEKIDDQINNLDSLNKNFEKEKKDLLDKKNKLLKKIYSNLTAWDKVQVARHTERPHTKDYISLIFKNVIYLHGDKKFSDDGAIIGCLGELSGESVMVISSFFIPRLSNFLIL